MQMTFTLKKDGMWNIMVNTPNFQDYTTISQATKKQIETVKYIWSKHLKEDLIGMYIHGSMALHCFLEEVSDIDILIVCMQKLTREQKISIARDIVEADLSPCPLEISAICIQDMKPWHHPTVCQFHYSDFWTEQYKKVFLHPLMECYILDHEFEDPDIACHVRLTKQCGIQIYGEKIENVFPDVPEEDFWNSISNEIEEYDFNAYNPKYYASNILILGRILSYKKEHYILSKYEGGIWTLHHIPDKYRYIVQNALEVWYHNAPMQDYEKEDLTGLREYLITEITT